MGETDGMGGGKTDLKKQLIRSGQRGKGVKKRRTINTELQVEEKRFRGS